MKKLIVIFAVIFASNAFAGCNTHTLAINLTSIHYSDPDPDLGIDEHNTKNFGLGYECQFSITSWDHTENNFTIGAGFYDNSYDETSLYVNGGIILNDPSDPVRFSIEVGLASGYEKVIEQSKIPSLNDDIAFYGGVGLRFGSEYNAVKFTAVTRFTGVQYHRGFDGGTKKDRKYTGINFR